MMVSPINSLLVILMLSSVLLSLVTVGVLLALKYRQYRSQPFLLSCCYFMLQAFGNGGIILRTILNGSLNAHFDSILRPTSLITGFLTIFFITAYIVEIKRPGKLTLKKYLYLISPFILASAGLILVHPDPIHSPEELFNGIMNTDILLRLTIVCFFFAYPLTAACLPYEWRKCLVPRNTVALLHILSCLIPPVFIAGLSCGYFPAVVANFFIAIFLDFLVAYIEFKVRIPVPESTGDYEVTLRQKDSASGEKTIDLLLDSPEIWMNPDMSATELAKFIGTNHTYLLDKIKERGYLSYSDMINRKRVDFIRKELEKRSDVNIISLMFEAGFRSRSTASREFRRIVGCSPSEYQELKKSSR